MSFIKKAKSHIAFKIDDWRKIKTSFMAQIWKNVLPFFLKSSNILIITGSDSFCNLLFLKDFLFIYLNTSKYKKPYIKNLIFQLFTKLRRLIFQKLSEPLNNGTVFLTHFYYYFYYFSICRTGQKKFLFSVT